MTSFFNRTLVLELKSGNHAGCTHLVDRYQARLLREAVHVFHIPREDAEEIVSDVLLAIVQNIYSFEFRRNDADFHAWVVSIFRNKIRDFIRRPASRAALVEHFETLDTADDSTCSPADRRVLHQLVSAYQDSVAAEDADGGGVLGEKLMFIAEALEQLRPWQRTLLRCRALDIPYEDIAHYTGLASSQLKVYYPRVRKKFIQILAESYPSLNQNAK